MRDNRFGRDARLSRREEFERVIAEGRKIVGRDLLLWSRKRPGASSEPSPVAPARIGVSVSRKLGGAVRRNRLKRLLREAFRLNRRRIPAGYDVVVYPRPGCGWAGLAEAEESLLTLCRRAGIIQELK